MFYILAGITLILIAIWLFRSFAYYYRVYKKRINEFTETVRRKLSRLTHKREDYNISKSS